MNTPTFPTVHIGSFSPLSFSKSYILIRVLFLLTVGFWATHASGQILYTNSGNNTTGFTPIVVSNSTGSLTTNGTDLIESGGSWDVLPVSLSGNFEINYQVYNDSYDGDSHLLLFNQVNYTGIDVRNSPQGTDTPTINIFSAGDLRTYNGFYIYTAPLVGATTTAFPNQTWTQITVTKTGNILTDNVGGQIIQYNIGSLGLPSTLGVGIGGYATTYLGGHGQLLYRDIVITAPEVSTSSLFAVGILAMAVMFMYTRKTIRR